MDVRAGDVEFVIRGKGFSRSPRFLVIFSFHLTGGIRGDIRLLHSFALEDKFVEFQRSFPGLTGSIGLVYSPVPSLNLRANLARGFRAPNLSELASNGVHEGTVRYEKGNPDLRPEFSLQGDLGADFSNKYLSASAALFCNRIQNYIFASRTADVTEGHPVYQYSADNALLYGGELSLDIHPVHRLHLNSQFSFVRGTFGQENMPLIPVPRLSGEIKWELSHGGKVFNDSYTAQPRTKYHNQVGLCNTIKKEKSLASRGLINL